MREICKYIPRIPVDPKREDDLILIPSSSTSDVAGTAGEEADAEVGVMEAPISDVMTTGIYQFREEDEDAAAAAEESNDTSETPVNGAENGGGGADGGAAELKCLDEPSFQFSEEQQQQQPKRPTYRVLEDPFEAAAQQVN